MEAPVNEIHERIRALRKRITEIERERQKAQKLLAITDVMVDDMASKVHAVLETTDRQELKAALTHFMERITVDGRDVTIEYTFKKPVTEKVPVTGDPGGI